MIGAPAVDALIASLKENQDTEVRRMAVTALGKTKDLRAVEALIAVLDDTNPTIRESVVNTLGSIREPRAVEPWIKALKKEPVIPGPGCLSSLWSRY
jgi:HEAT repeat protein